MYLLTHASKTWTQSAPSLALRLFQSLQPFVVSKVRLLLLTSPTLLSLSALHFFKNQTASSLSQSKDRFIGQMACFLSARPHSHPPGPRYRIRAGGCLKCVPFIHMFWRTEREQAPKRPLEVTWNSQNCFSPLGGGRKGFFRPSRETHSVPKILEG